MSDPLGPDPNRGPTGEAEIIDAVIASAAKLFAENEPGSVPLRTIAREAGVNYGLLHRHFGTKVDLVQATVRRYSDAFEPSNDAKNDPVQLIAEMASYYLNNASIARALAWAAMNGADENTLVGGLRDVTALVEQMETEAASPRDADILFAFAASAVLGVTVFGGVGLAAAGAKPDQDRHDLHALTIDLIASVVEQARPGPNPS